MTFETIDICLYLAIFGFGAIITCGFITLIENCCCLSEDKDLSKQSLASIEQQESTYS